MRELLFRLEHEERRRILEDLAGALGREEQIEFAYVYGSFAEDLPFHDIDLGLYLSVVLPQAASDCLPGLAGRLSRMVRFPVDVRVLNHAPVAFLYHALRGLLVFERNEALRAQVAERAVQRYLDLKPLIRRGIREAFAS